jgi:tRNA (uracil-5-)-methyltransferase TRM9
MKASTVASLLSLNRQFYQTLARQFSSTRRKLQPGVKQILKTIEPTSSLLDLGCGNGELARELAKKGHRGAYVGVDFSQEMLVEARAGLPKAFSAKFHQVDLGLPDWDAAFLDESFEIILAFAVLHHLPGDHLRCQILEKVHAKLVPSGRFIHSEWQFLNSPRLQQRLVPWERVNLSSSDADPGDFLLDWRHGGYGLRYVHHFSLEELQTLAEKTAFRIIDTFYSDGEGGNLGLYQTWEAIES